jgi:2-keto-4-pentenoate hydratase/2-oxohepta-3-ene-1,7-dioic acid hydratase in catechol pathway
MVYSGKVYETAGAEAIAVYEAEQVRPLSPIPHAPSVRIFRTDLQPGLIAGMDAEEPYFFYANPSSLHGASQIINFPVGMGDITVQPYLAAVLVSDGFNVSLDDADDIILGYTMLAMVTSRTAEQAERRTGVIGRSNDLGAVIGPVITTPDELEAETVDGDNGRHYGLDAFVKVNGVERAVGNTADIPFTFAQAIRAASETTIVRSGDVFAMGPVAIGESPINLDPGDEVQLAIGMLGAVALKLSTT